VNNNRFLSFNALTVKGRYPPQYTLPFILLWFYLMMAETCCRWQTNACSSKCCVHSDNKNISILCRREHASLRTI